MHGNFWIEPTASCVGINSLRQYNSHSFATIIYPIIGLKLMCMEETK